MSKASEYVKRLNANPALMYKNNDGNLVAYIENDGLLRIALSRSLSAEDALEFGHWLIDTYGEEKP